MCPQPCPCEDRPWRTCRWHGRPWDLLSQAEGGQGPASACCGRKGSEPAGLVQQGAHGQAAESGQGLWPCPQEQREAVPVSKCGSDRVARGALQRLWLPGSQRQTEQSLGEGGPRLAPRAVSICRGNVPFKQQVAVPMQRWAKYPSCTRLPGAAPCGDEDRLPSEVGCRDREEAALMAEQSGARRPGQGRARRHASTEQRAVRGTGLPWSAPRPPRALSVLLDAWTLVFCRWSCGCQWWTENGDEAPP